MKEQNSRKGWDTKITSASVSPHFQKILIKYRLSPTEAFRKGIAVELFDRGATPYVTSLNRARSMYVKTFLKDLDKHEFETKVERFLEKLEEIQEIMQSITKNAR